MSKSNGTHMKPVKLNNGYTLRIVDESAPPDCILYQTRNDAFKDITQTRITNEACITYLGKIPNIGEEFTLPFYLPGNPCTRIA